MSPRLCLTCGATLRSGNETDYCSVHQPKAKVAAPCFLEGDELAFVIAGILFIHRGMRPGRVVVLQRELCKIGIEATTEQIHKAKEKLERRGLDIHATPRRPGYVLRDWLTPALVWAARQQQRELLTKGSGIDEEET